MAQATLDVVPANVAVIDATGTVLAVNTGWQRFAAECGNRRSSVGDNYLTICAAAPEDPFAARAAAGLRDVIAGRREEFGLDYPCHDATHRRWFVLRATRCAGPGPVRVIVAHHNLTRHREIEAHTQTQAALLDEVDVSLVATGADGSITHWNRGAETIYGWTHAEAIGRDAVALMVPEDRSETAGIAPELRDRGRWEGRFTARRKDGSTVPLRTRTSVLRDRDGHDLGSINVSMDVTAEVAADRLLTAATNHLRAVTDNMAEGLVATDVGGRVTLVNQAAEALLGWAQDDLRGLDLHQTIHRRQPDGSGLAVDACSIEVTRVDGITVRRDDDVFVRRDGTELPVAYTASPLVTADGIDGCVVVFSDDTRRRAEQHELRQHAHALQWVGRIQEALTEDRFILYAQPILDLRTDQVVQRELLLRLREPDGTIVAPGVFLPIAEQYRLIGEIDRWVIRQAVNLAATGLAVELNVSAQSITDPAVVAHVEACLRETGAVPDLLVFEVTETALVEDDPAAQRFAKRVRELGCKLALDDFGTGYGGFTYLKQFPVDYLKIDIEFVRDLVTNRASRHVVQAVVALARGFGLQCVAEGVEDAETLELLKDLDVDFAQGYHVGRPAPLVEPAPAAHPGTTWHG